MVSNSQCRHKDNNLNVQVNAFKDEQNQSKQISEMDGEFAEFGEWKLRHLAGTDLTSFPPLFSPDGEFLFVICNKEIKVYSTLTGLPAKYLSGAPDKIISMELELNNENMLVACTESGYVLRWLWNSASLFCTVKLLVREGVFFSFNLLNLYEESDTPLALVTFKSPRMKVQASVVDITTGRLAKNHNQPKISLTNQIPKVAVNITTFKYFVIAQGFYVFFVNYKNWTWRRYKSPLQTPVNVVRVNPTEEAVATGDATGKVFIWRSFHDHKMMRNTLYHWHHTQITGMAFSASGSSFYSSGMEAVLVKWNINDPDCRQYAPRMPSIILHISVSSDNNKVAIVTADNGIIILNEVFKKKCVIQEFTYMVNDKTGRHNFPVGLRLNPRNNTIALNGRSGHLQFYSSYTRSLLFNIDIVGENRQSIETSKILYNTEVTCAAFNIDWMATGEVYNDDEHIPELRLKFWNYKTESQNYSLNTCIDVPHEGGFRAIEFSNEFHIENLLCASVGCDNVIKVWSLGKSESIYKPGKVWFCVAKASYKSFPVESISFSQDGSVLAAGFGNTLCLYKSDDLKLKAALSTSPGYDGGLQKTQICIAKKNLNGSRKELSEHQKKIIQLFKNLLENNETSLIQEIQKTLNVSENRKSQEICDSFQITEHQKQRLFKDIMQLNVLNLIQKVTLFQKLEIGCKVHPELETRMANYLRQAQRDPCCWNKRIHRIKGRERFKAKYRLDRIITRNVNYDTEVSSKLVPLFSVMNLHQNSTQQPPLTNGNKEVNNERCEKRIIPPVQTIVNISRVFFATGEYAHLAIACTHSRILIWNILTLRLQTVLKISVEHIAFDPLKNLIAAFTKNQELYVFQPNTPIPLYCRPDMPRIYGAIWLPRRHPKSRSLTLDWQAISTLYFLTENQEIMYLASNNDITEEENISPLIAFENEATVLTRYTTFGAFAAKQISNVEQRKQSSQSGPLIFGASGESFINSLIEMPTHTMPPMSLICEDIIRSFSRKTVTTEESSSGKSNKEVASSNSGSHTNYHWFNSSEEIEDNDQDDAADEMTEKMKIRKAILTKSDEVRKTAKKPPHREMNEHDIEKHLSKIAEQTIDIQF